MCFLYFFFGGGGTMAKEEEEEEEKGDWGFDFWWTISEEWVRCLGVN